MPELGFGAGLVAGLILVVAIMIAAGIIDTITRWWEKRNRG